MRKPRPARLAPFLTALLAWLLLTAGGARATPTLAHASSMEQRFAEIGLRLRSAVESHLRRNEVRTTSLTKLTPQCPAGLAPGCLTPAQVRAAYGVDRLAEQGLDGSGQTIVIIVSFGSPTIAQDLAAFDAAMGLPDPNLQQLFPLGHDFSTGPYCASDDIQTWGEETTLDVEWAHAMAPGAAIIVLASPVSETEGVVGMSEFLQLLQYARDHHLGSIVSQSWDTSEDLLADDKGAALRAQFDAFYRDATLSDITVFDASGDAGGLGDDLVTCQSTNVVAADWPATVPWLTTVGGTQLSVPADGSPPTERVLAQPGVASGAGVSRFYAQPQEQSLLPDATQRMLHGMRGEADVSAVGSGLIVYKTDQPGGQPRPRPMSGTSASTPIWAGIIALAAQEAGGPLGNINPILYALGASGRCFHDITGGTNAFHGDPGSPVGPGWDLPTGWGSPDASCLVPAIADAVRKR